MRAAKNLSAAGFHTVADNLAAAMIAFRRNYLNRALEAIKDMRFALRRDLEGFIVIVSAQFTFRHTFISPPKTMLRAAQFQNQKMRRGLSPNMVPFKIEQLPRNLKKDVEEYLEEHPHSPAARLRPGMAITRNLWLAFVGPKLEEGAARIGNSPCEALQDFNRHFMEPLVSRNGHEPG
jgi:hypothetical protein